MSHLRHNIASLHVCLSPSSTRASHSWPGLERPHFSDVVVITPILFIYTPHFMPEVTHLKWIHKHTAGHPSPSHVYCLSLNPGLHCCLQHSYKRDMRVTDSTDAASVQTVFPLYCFPSSRHRVQLSHLDFFPLLFTSPPQKFGQSLPWFHSRASLFNSCGRGVHV